MTTLRDAAQQALEALEWHLARGTWGADLEGCAANLRAARTAERKRIVALLREMHDKVTPMHNFYAYAANIVEASGEEE